MVSPESDRFNHVAVCGARVQVVIEGVIAEKFLCIQIKRAGNDRAGGK
jgi:hypothetical protein